MRIEIGFVLRAHGLKGLVRVRSSDSILDLSRVFVGDSPVEIVRVQRDKDEFLVELKGITDRDAAELLKGAPLSAERSELPAPSQDEVYLADLVGCRVFDTQQNDLGEVIAVEVGAQELLTIRGAREWQLPYPLVVEVDVAQKKIVCDPPEGLVDL